MPSDEQSIHMKSNHLVAPLTRCVGLAKVENTDSKIYVSMSQGKIGKSHKLYLQFQQNVSILKEYLFVNSIEEVKFRKYKGLVSMPYPPNLQNRNSWAVLIVIALVEKADKRLTVQRIFQIQS